MDNAEQMAIQGTQDEEKQSKNTTQYLLDVTICKYLQHAIRGITCYKLRRFNSNNNMYYMYVWLARGIHAPNTVYSNVNKQQYIIEKEYMDVHGHDIL